MHRLIGTFFVLLALCYSFSALAQAYPNRLVRIIVPYPPGGTVDTVARVIAARMTENIGQQFIIDNRAGASGTIGSTVVSKAAPDGYSLLFQASTFVASPLLISNVPYDIEKDFTPITNVGAVPLLVVTSQNVAAKNLKEFIAAIKTEPKKYVFGTSAVGSASHLAEEAIKFEAKIDFMILPYKGTAPALLDVTAARIPMIATTIINSIKVKPIWIRRFIKSP